MSQYFLPNRKTISSLYQAPNIEVPPGDPANMSFQWNLGAAVSDELTRIIDVDKYIWGMAGSFFHADSTAGAGVFVQIYHIQQSNGNQRPLYSKPRPLDSVMGSRATNDNNSYVPMLLKPTYPLQAGDSVMVQVFSQDMALAQLVEVILFCNQTSTAGFY